MKPILKKKKEVMISETSLDTNAKITILYSNFNTTAKTTSLMKTLLKKSNSSLQVDIELSNQM